MKLKKYQRKTLEKSRILWYVDNSRASADLSTLRDRLTAEKLCYNRWMATSWNHGFTKETHPSVRKISQTMLRNKIDNFAEWREKARRSGKIKTNPASFLKNGDLAELLGVILGDGHIEKFPRTERLLIFSNSNNQGFVERYSKMVKRVFGKDPYVYKQTNQNCIRISLYEKEISKRLRIPSGARKDIIVRVPGWVRKDRGYVIRYLRGLYEAEGSLSFHPPTYTHKFEFSNRNQSLLKNVEGLLKGLGFSPHPGHSRVQISKKDEVKQIVELLKFRKYDNHCRVG